MKKLLKILSIASFLCTSIALVAVCTVNKQVQEQSGDLVVTTERNNDSAIKLNARTSTAESGKTQVTVTAVTEFVDVENKTLNWELVWSTENAKNVSDYVLMTVSEDTLSVVLTYVNQFSTQLVLNVASDYDSSKTASCTVDCYKRVTEIKNGMNWLGPAAYEYNVDAKTINFSSIFEDVDSIKYGGITVGNKDAMFENGYVTKTGTIETELSYSYRFKLSDELKAELAKYSNLSYEERYITVDSHKLSDTLKGLIKVDGSTLTITNLLNIGEVRQALAATNNWFVMEITMNDTYNGNVVNSLVEEWTAMFSLPYEPTVSVALEESSLIF